MADGHYLTPRQWKEQQRLNRRTNAGVRHLSQKSVKRRRGSASAAGTDGTDGGGGGNNGGGNGGGGGDPIETCPGRIFEIVF